jgi:microcystin-dependent protein
MSDPYVGEIRMFAGNFAPDGWLFCNGQIVRINDYEALFSLIGTTYGGDGVTNFAVPDLTGRVPLHRGKGASGTNYIMGELGGVESVTLLERQLPRHSHAANASSSPGTAASPANAYWAGSTIAQYSLEVPAQAMSSQSITATGGSLPHDNMMPFLAISFIISCVGIYPSEEA